MSFLKKTGKMISKWLSGFRLEVGWERGAVITLGVLVLITAGFAGYDSQSGYGRWVDVLAHLVIATIGYLILLRLGAWLLKQLMSLPAILWAVIIIAGAVGEYVWGGRTWLHWVFNLALVFGTLLLGISIYAIRREWGAALLRKKILLSVFLLLGIGIMTTFLVLWLSPGQPAASLKTEVILGPPTIQAENPGLPGEYQVLTLSYGTGNEKHRDEYREGADLLTQPVNASAYVNYSGWNERLRKIFYGYEVSSLPLNGLVWFPEGEGPFPLVLIVHGNHTAGDPSDPGYAYLGELLASRGMITVSVDQNFLNGGFFGRSSGENDARAWILLQHLEQWEDWNADPGSPFYQIVDLDKIALIGHSRGGEAAALAATFNRLTRYPGNAHVRWHFDFGIKSVVAIAPVDMQWRPADHPNPLTDVNYLILQGSHDADLYYYDGIQQYRRAEFTYPDAENYKAAVYIYRANHGQFNTSWGDRDYGGVRGRFLNTRALLSAEEQQQLARVMISAFLEDTLKENEIYRKLFEDYRTAGDWLPQTGYITQFADYGVMEVAGFEEDIDPQTVSLNGAAALGSGLTRWREKALRYRNGDRQDNHAVLLGWKSQGGRYAVDLPPGLDWSLNEASLLVFNAADARDPEDAVERVDFRVEIRDSSGKTASIILSSILPLQTQFPAEIYRFKVWNEEYVEEESEAVFQSYRIPLAKFLADNPALNLARLQSIRFIFDQTESGEVYLDGIGFDVVD